MLVAPLRVPRRVAVAAVVERERAVVGRDHRREVVPDVGVVSEAVQKEERHALLAPLEKVEIEAVGTGNASGAGLHARILAR